MKKIWRDIYKIHSYDVNFKGLLSMPTLCQFMQESAWNHAENLQLGFSHLMKKNLIWVLARQKVVVDVYPQWGDTLTMETWPTGRDRLFCYRDFKFQIGDRHVGRGTTTWFVVDLKDHRPQRTDSYFDVKVVESASVFTENAVKIEPLQCVQSNKMLRVSSRDLDVYEHVNNVKYTEWIVDAFSFDYHKQNSLRELTINYLAEGMYDDELAVNTEEREPSSYYHSIIRRADEKELCRARTLWHAVG